MLDPNIDIYEDTFLVNAGDDTHLASCIQGRTLVVLSQKL